MEQSKEPGQEKRELASTAGCIYFQPRTMLSRQEGLRRARIYREHLREKLEKLGAQQDNTEQE